MFRFLMRRLMWMFLVLVVVSAITFLLMHAVPGGPFDRAGERALPPAVVENLRRKYNLDQPLPVQYLNYMSDIFVPRLLPDNLRYTAVENYLIRVPLPGDRDLFMMNFGPSYASRSRNVNDFFRQQLPVSAQLGAAALLVATSIGVPLGIIAALRRNTAADYTSMGVAILGVSVPVLVLGPILRYMAVQTGWFPVSGWGTWQQALLPAFALGFSASALLARLTRASLLQVLNEDYVRTARAKGLAERIVVLRHALKNALIPVVTVFGPLAAALLTGTFVAETVFAIPGIGRYFITSITNRDYPVLMGTVLLYAFVLVLANTLVDMLYAWLDPRIRYD